MKHWTSNLEQPQSLNCLTFVQIINATGHESRVVASRALQNCADSVRLQTPNDARVHDAPRRVRVFIDTDTDFNTESSEFLSLRIVNWAQDADWHIDIVTRSARHTFPFPIPEPASPSQILCSPITYTAPTVLIVESITLAKFFGMIRRLVPAH